MNSGRSQISTMSRRPTAIEKFPQHLVFRLVIRTGKRHPLGIISGAVIAVMLFASASANIIAPYDPYKADYSVQFSSPNALHWLGTDEFGRDILSRIIYGSRFALIIGVGAAFLGTTIGALIGVVSAYFGGKADLLLQRFMDGLLAVPQILLALVIVSLMGNKISNLIIAIGVPMIPRASRVIRSSALSLKRAPFVEAARSIAATDMRIIFRHIVPNVVAPYLVLLSTVVGQAILIDAALGFLGLGSTEPTPSWGVMLSGSASLYAVRAPWMVLSPGACITLGVFAFNLLGDSLRDALDPRLGRFSTAG
jgi:peptide/nickel transport system permease protein